MTETEWTGALVAEYRAAAEAWPSHADAHRFAQILGFSGDVLFGDHTPRGILRAWWSVFDVAMRRAKLDELRALLRDEAAAAERVKPRT